MNKEKWKIFHLDGLDVKILFRFDENSEQYFGDYPDFEEHPLYSPRGRPVVGAVRDSCPYAEPDIGDCGSCPHYLPENKGDLIGICMNDKKKKHHKEDLT